jgi:hypothetical protein
VGSCIVHLVNLGLSCSTETPKDRQKMQYVYAEVITIKEALAAIHRLRKKDSSFCSSDGSNFLFRKHIGRNN